jgi:adenylosuccinate lyase
VEHETLVMAGRSHNVAAQPTTLGKRFATYGEELLWAEQRVERLVDTLPLRGVKGPVGTQQDMLDLFDGDQDRVNQLESRVAQSLGFDRTMNSVGQVYPRSMDFDVVTALQQTAAGPSSFAKTVRLMAGQELATEGFAPGRVGSSAMPHKMNASRSERVTGLYSVLAGHTTMVGHLAGDQWNEGDVSCSATRRVAIPDAFRAADGVQLTTMSVLDGFGAYPEVVHAELERYLPFLATSKALMAAVRAGAGREDAHRVIKKHATAVALEMREQGTRENDLFDRLHSDPEIPVSRDQLDDAIGNPITMTGSAGEQVQRFAQTVENLVFMYPDAAAYTPPKIR